MRAPCEIHHQRLNQLQIQLTKKKKKQFCSITLTHINIAANILHGQIDTIILTSVFGMCIFLEKIKILFSVEKKKHLFGYRFIQKKLFFFLSLMVVSLNK